MSSTTPLLFHQKTQLGARLPQPQRYVPCASDVCRRFQKIHEADKSLHYTTVWDENYPRINVSILETVAHCFLAEARLKLYGDDGDKRSSLGHFRSVLSGLHGDATKELIKTLGIVEHMEKIVLESKGEFSAILRVMMNHSQQQFMTTNPESCGSTMLVELDHIMIMMYMCCTPLPSPDLPYKTKCDMLRVEFYELEEMCAGYSKIFSLLASNVVPEILTGAFGQDPDWNVVLGSAPDTPGSLSFPLAPAWFEANTALAWTVNIYINGVKSSCIQFDHWKFVYHQMLTNYSGMLRTELDLIASTRTKAIALGQTIFLSSFTWLANNWDKIASHFEGDE